MTTPSLHWKNGELPPNTAIFAIGDIHSQADLLQTLLIAIKKKTSELPKNVVAYIIFVGDYIDRGDNAKKTIDILQSFEQEMAQTSNVITKFLCGNHDEIVRRFLEACEIVAIMPDIAKKHEHDYSYLATTEDGKISLRALESWLFSGGGITTIKNYYPAIKNDIFDFDNKCFKHNNHNFNLDTINSLLREFSTAVPAAHKDFFARSYENHYLILGNYLFTHAGIDPDLELLKQGIGEGAIMLAGRKYIDFLMIRDKFLWRDDLPNCPYIVVHGHTPSAIELNGNIVADGQKHYRLCIDTGVYASNGALTCFFRHANKAEFLAVNRRNPAVVVEYVV